jgi:Acetyltransferase (GNAT) domain
VLGRLAFTYRRRLGLRILSQPPLTPFCGPWIKSFPGKPATRTSREDDVLDRLIAALPPHDVFRQRFHYAVRRWLPFHWAGLRQSTQFTYVIINLVDLDRIWVGLRENVRTQIRKAQKMLSVDHEGDVETLLGALRLTFRRQGLDMPYSADLVRRLDRACAAQGARRILVARDASDRVCAATCMVWDDQSAYSLISGNDPEHKSSGAMSLLLWESIKLAREVTGRFDFEGSMMRPVERFFRAFGGEPIACSQLVGGRTLAGRMALSITDLLIERRRLQNAR